MSGRALLVLAISLVKRNEISVDEVKTVTNELFDGGDDGKKIVIDELMNLDDQYFEDIAHAIAPKAAVVIASPNEELRKALAKFFVRISRKWSAGDSK
jgi:ATP-dependent exoDNAse (exonuclease V) alpha subunit